MEDWAASVFGSSSNGVTALQMSARAVVVLVFGLAVVRVFGRRIFGRWTPLDVILSVLIGSNLSRALTGNAPLVATIVATTVLLVIYWAIVRAAIGSTWVSWLVKGREATLIRDGRIDWDEVRRQGLGWRDLEEALHAEGHETAEGVHLAVLERNGDINVIARRNG